MGNERFTLIEGGRQRKNVTDGPRQLEECYVTNTRLMGVLAMYMRFRLPESREGCIHQFFYFDTEEFGFETYKSVLGNDLQRVKEIGNGLMGGLGGEPRSLTLREAAYLVQHYARFNHQRHIPMPEGIGEYGFLLNMDVRLSEPDQYILNGKICVRLQNDYETVNYFLMRCFGKDFEGAALLCRPGLETELFPDYKQGTFCKNIIDEGKSPGEYLCESLVEFDNCYHLTVTKVQVASGVVISYHRISTLTVSAMEAAMMLSRSEFVNVYGMSGGLGASGGLSASGGLGMSGGLGASGGLGMSGGLGASGGLGTSGQFVPSRSLSKLTEGAMIHDYPCGKLFMIFHPHNNHVAKKEYRLNEDVLGLYYFSDNQLVCASYSKEDIWELEKDLAKSSLRGELKPRSRYEFQEPVIYEYINSGFRSFDDFVSLISGEDE